MGSPIVPSQYSAYTGSPSSWLTLYSGKYWNTSDLSPAAAGSTCVPLSSVHEHRSDPTTSVFVCVCGGGGTTVGVGRMGEHPPQVLGDSLGVVDLEQRLALGEGQIDEYGGRALPDRRPGDFRNVFGLGLRFPMEAQRSTSSQRTWGLGRGAAGGRLAS